MSIPAARSILTLVSLLFAVPAAAQTTKSTLPSGYLKTEGNGNFGVPWYWTNARSLSLYDARSIPSSLRSIRGLRIRPDGKVSRMNAKTLTVEVAISNRGVVAAVPPFSTNWAKHYGTDRKIMMKRRTIRLPAATASTSPPHPWSNGFTLPLDSPWLRSGGAKDALCIDIKTWTARTTSALWYADADAPGRHGNLVTIGKSCPSSATYFAGGAYQNSQLGLYTGGYTRGFGDLCVAWIGASQVTVPFGTYRSQPCTIYTLPLVLHSRIAKTTSGSGYTGHWVWAKPVTPALVGMRFLSQMGFVNTRFEFRTSNAVSITIGPGSKGSYRQGTVYNMAINATAFNPDRDAAKYMSNQALIFGLY